MPQPSPPAERVRAVLESIASGKTQAEVARETGIPARTVSAWARRFDPTSEPFEVEAPLPSMVASAEDILERRKREFARVSAAHNARKLINIKVNIPGPIGIAHFGDPHVDDSGTDIGKLERDSDICNKTEGLFAANLGDTTNSWVGRLARLYSEQSTSAAEAWVIAEWFVRRNRWIYMIAGNHDLWQGAGDPLQWISRSVAPLYEAHGVRLNLQLPAGREVRINARHDFRGDSMWNTTHGPAKAAQMGWRDHILICGHKHISGYQIVKDPSSGLLSHCIRVASYKAHDRYAAELGLPDQNFSENVMTLIDPDADERSLVKVFLDLKEGAEYLTWKRAKWEQTA